MRRWVLVRLTDVTGVSGEGVVVWGIQFPDGAVAYRWNSPHATSSTADSIETVQRIHEHDGASRVVWLDGPDGARTWEWLSGDPARSLGLAEREIGIRTHEQAEPVAEFSVQEVLPRWPS